MRSISTTLKRRRVALLGLLIGGWCAGGCGSAGGGVDLIDLNYRRIYDTDSLIRHVDIQQAYWWTDGERVYIALTASQPGLSKFNRKRFDLSMALSGLVASQSRTYQLGPDSVRAYLHQGFEHERYRSVRGIASVRIDRSGRLTGRFRLTAAKEFFYVLTNWSPAGPVVVVGTFTASKNEKTGLEILKRSEEDGMDRRRLRNTVRRNRTKLHPNRSKPVRVRGPDPMQPAS